MINRECQLVSSVIISNKIIFEQENKIPECDESMVMYLIKRLIFTKVYKLRKTWIFSSKGICSFKVRSLLLIAWLTPRWPISWKKWISIRWWIWRRWSISSRHYLCYDEKIKKYMICFIIIPDSIKIMNITK